MAIKNTQEAPKTPKKQIVKTIVGILFLVIGLLLLASFISYFFNGFIFIFFQNLFILFSGIIFSLLVSYMGETF